MIFDTGPLLAAANRDDPDHQRCVDLIVVTALILVPGPVVAEAGFMIGRIAGAQTEASFLRSIATSRFEVLAPTQSELRRAADLVEQYGDLPLGTTDAIVMASAESRSDPKVATLDMRHFSVVRPDRFEAFEIHPSQ